MPDVLIVDDHPVVRAGLAYALDETEGIRVVGACADRTAALRLIREHKPDVVVLDLKLNGDDGLDLMAEMKRNRRDLRVLLLTMMDDQMTVRRARALHADGYFLKTADLEELAEAVRQVARGVPAWDPRLIGILADRPAAGESRSIVDQLTYQEAQIVDRVARGLTNRQIATDMKLSEKTVRNYLSRVMDKTGTKRRAEVAAVYVRSLSV